MSGHSKWANIKRQKAVVDVKKGATYAKMSREIIVAAKLGGGDPNGNFRLRQAIERAKIAGVPNDNIHRAIEKGIGTGEASSIEELTYEGYGPGGVAIMVRSATDNRNRTAGDLRSYFSKYGGNMGDTGCVAWMFKERGEISIEKSTSINEDDLMMAALDAGADDLDSTDDEMITIICDPQKIESIRNVLVAAKYKIKSAEATMSAINNVPITDRDNAKQLLKLLDILENHDDVQHVYANFDMEAELLKECMV